MIPNNLPSVLRPIFEAAVKKATAPCKGCEQRRDAILKKLRLRPVNRAINQTRPSERGDDQ
jgi:hypothetical protein